MRKSNALEALFSNAIRGILTATFMQPSKWWYMSELASYLGLRPSSLQRPLAALVGAGILVRTREGNRIYFRAEQANPLFRHLQGIIAKTAGIVGCCATCWRPSGNESPLPSSTDLLRDLSSGLRVTSTSWSSAPQGSRTLRRRSSRQRPGLATRSTRASTRPTNSGASSPRNTTFSRRFSRSAFPAARSGRPRPPQARGASLRCPALAPPRTRRRGYRSMRAVVSGGAAPGAVGCSRLHWNRLARAASAGSDGSANCACR